MRYPEILVVDDEVYTTEIIRKRLRAEGLFRVTIVHNGQDAIAKALEIHPDLILLDIMLPDINGYEVLKSLREHQRTKDIPIIFLTVKEMIKDKVEGLAIGASDYITKPFSAEELTARVKAVLRTKFLYHELLEKALLEERDFISAELHDGIGAHISSMSLLASLALKKLDREPQEKIREMIQELSRKSRETLDHLKKTVYVLKYDSSKKLGEKLEELLSDSFYLKDIEYEFKWEGETAFEPALDLAIFRIFQESVSNILKHSGAGHVKLSLACKEDGVKLHIEDDGRGFDRSAAQGFGLRNMEKRVGRFGGEISFTTDKGTTIDILIPYSKEDIKSSLLC